MGPEDKAAGAGLVVYGYLRAEQPDEIEIAEWRAEIQRFCRDRGLCLQSVFVDRRESDDSVERPALGGLMERLEMPEVHALVTPSLAHLSEQTEVLSMLRKNIRRTGSQVIVIYPGPDEVKADGA